MAKYKYLEKYELTFYDHYIAGDKKEIICKTVGYYLNSTDDYDNFSYWLVDTDDKEMFDNNLEKFSILSVAIIKKKLLK